MLKETTFTADNYELVSGLEVHVQLNTATKIFCTDSASSGGSPNEHISAVSLALPGALPKLNREVIEKAVRIGLALNCTINQYNTFDRKNYFYADLPKGYQLTQDKLPVCKEGWLSVELANGQEKTIRINRIHLEEDAGKSLHDQHKDYSFVDLNRAGVPLIEIVTEPDIRTAEEAAALLTAIRKLVRHLNVSDGNMEEGSLRCDANISVREIGTKDYGTRCEVKNLNSIRNLRRAIDFEFKRQVNAINSGKKIIQSTLSFNADTGETAPMRTKEMANDYRYFPDPDLQPVYISDEWLAAISSAMPLLPDELARQLVLSTGISHREAILITEDQGIFAYFNAAKQDVNNVKSLVNWLLGPIRALLSERQQDIGTFAVDAVQMAKIINLVNDKQVTQQNALQQLIPALEKASGSEPFELARQLNLIIENNEDALEMIINSTLLKYPAQVAAYKKGKKGVLGLFIGEILKMNKGRADPQKVNALLLDKLK